MCRQLLLRSQAAAAQHRHGGGRRQRCSLRWRIGNSGRCRHSRGHDHGRQGRRRRRHGRRAERAARQPRPSPHHAVVPTAAAAAAAAALAGQACAPQLQPRNLRLPPQSCRSLGSKHPQARARARACVQPGRHISLPCRPARLGRASCTAGRTLERTGGLGSPGSCRQQRWGTAMAAVRAPKLRRELHRVQTTTRTNITIRVSVTTVAAFSSPIRQSVGPRAGA